MLIKKPLRGTIFIFLLVFMQSALSQTSPVFETSSEDDTSQETSVYSIGTGDDDYQPIYDVDPEDSLKDYSDVYMGDDGGDDRMSLLDILFDNSEMKSEPDTETEAKATAEGLEAMENIAEAANGLMKFAAFMIVVVIMLRFVVRGG